MGLLVRKVYLHGKSLTFTLPGAWDVPDILHVYTNGIYLVYSQLKGLETYYKARYIGKIRKRVAKYTRNGKEKEYYLITIPRKAADTLRIKKGTMVFIIETEEYETPTYIVFTNIKEIEKHVKKLVI